MNGHPKFRIKVPRLSLATKMHRKFSFHVKYKAIASDKDKGSTRTSLASVFSSVLRNKRYSLAKYPFKLKKNEKEKHHITALSLSNEFEQKPVVAALSQLFLLEQALEQDQRGEGKQSIIDKQRLKILFGFLDKKEGWNNFITAKWRASKNDLHGVVTKLGRVRRKVGLWCLVKIPSKLMIISLKLKMIRSLMKKKVTKQFAQEADEDNDRELCKKRILMGQRCRPLCSPSPINLDYYTNRFFLPEIVS